MEKSWIVKARKLKAEYQIKNKDLAEKMSNSEQWVSGVLKGKREAEDSERKFMSALDEIIKERNGK